MTTPPSHDDILAQVAAGDLSPDAPAVRAAVAQDPALARRLTELLETQAVLDRAAAEERALRADVASASLPGFDVRAALGGRLAQTARRPRGHAPLLAAAALLAAGLTWYFGPGSARRDPDIPLGGTVQVAPPERIEGGLLRFSWRLEGRTAHRYAATLTADDSPAVLARSERLTQPTWTIDADTSASLPPRVRLTTTAFDAAGDAVAAGEALLDLPR